MNRGSSAGEQKTSIPTYTWRRRQELADYGKDGEEVAAHTLDTSGDQGFME